VAGNTVALQHYAGGEGVLELTQLDPGDTTYHVPDGSTARLRWLFADLQDDGGPNRLSVTLNIFPNIDASPIQVHAVPANIVGGRSKVLWNVELGTASAVADATGAGTNRVSYNPLPLVTLDQTGFITLGFVNGSLNNPPVLQAEVFRTAGASAAGGASDLYLLPALG
jgi:hypothetical protein